MKIFFLALLLLTSISSSFAFASDKPKPINFLLAGGSELRPYKDVNGDFNNQTLSNYAFGLGVDEYVFIFETADFKMRSGNNTLNVETTYRDYMLWANYRTVKWTTLVPFIAVGIGGYSQSVTTTLSGISRNDNSPNKLLTGVGFGLQIETPVIYSSLEARAFFGDELDSQPTLGAAFRIGLWF